ALFYSHQLRAALADLRLLRRKGRKAAVLHQHGMRLDTRDETGVKRIIREGRREQAPDPIELRRVTDPGSFYVDPPRGAPQWLAHVHPDRPDPARAIDPVAWRPASARVPPPRHTPGLQAAGSKARGWGGARVCGWVSVGDLVNDLRHTGGGQLVNLTGFLLTNPHPLTCHAPSWHSASTVLYIFTMRPSVCHDIIPCLLTH
ncbi:hypothetical protein Vafri_2927, partial [Volvox africanus]